MNISSLRRRVKPLVPAPIRWVLRGGFHYFQRMYHWIMVLRQVRGYTLRDQAWLYLSAMTAIFTSLRALQEWRDPVALSNLNVHVPGVGNFWVRAGTDDLWHVLPYREDEVFKAIEKNLKPGSTFVDAGANIGFYTILASRLVGDDGQVIAIEMMPETARILEEHVTRNGCDNVEIHQYALSEHAGMTISATIPAGKYGQASITDNPDRAGCEVVCVTTSTLDDLLSGMGRIDLLKMDIEGAELGAIKGAKETLERVDSIIFEDRKGNSAVREILSNQGFILRPCGRADVFAQRI